MNKSGRSKTLIELNDRSKDIFKAIIDGYLKTGEPIGSANISKNSQIHLSPASIRSVMVELEEQGLIYSPHISAGRIPTEKGLRLFVDSFIEVGLLNDHDKKFIKKNLKKNKKNDNMEDILDKVSNTLSDISRCAGLVMVDKISSPLKHIEFIMLEPTKALMVVVNSDDKVENHLLDISQEISPSMLIAASNYLNSRISGLTLSQARVKILNEITSEKMLLDDLSANLIKTGSLLWSGSSDDKNLIVRGRAHLLDDISLTKDFDRISMLLSDLEKKKDIIKILEFAEKASGVNIFIGSENPLYSLSGSSMIIAPYGDANNNIIGMLGVIGPTSVNYMRIIPLVDYTSKMISHYL